MLHVEYNMALSQAIIQYLAVLLKTPDSNSLPKYILTIKVHHMSKLVEKAYS